MLDSQETWSVWCQCDRQTVAAKAKLLYELFILEMENIFLNTDYEIFAFILTVPL